MDAAIYAAEKMACLHAAIAEAVAAEREECAVFAKNWLQERMSFNTRFPRSPELLADAIRAREEEIEQ